ncbi:MAG: hypothetical protein HKM93_21345 [Desulfobacteraceae bacterium]|nr:hypothetical protein [Desulfobacteraceae bacterium]
MKDLDKLDVDITPLIQWAEANRSRTFKDPEIATRVQTTYGQEADVLVNPMNLSVLPGSGRYASV